MAIQHVPVGELRTLVGKAAAYLSDEELLTLADDIQAILMLRSAQRSVIHLDVSEQIPQVVKTRAC